MESRRYAYISFLERKGYGDKMKVVINRCYGGFGLSDKATALLAEKMGVEKDKLDIYDIPRNYIHLVNVVEELGLKADDPYSDLVIVEIPDDVNYTIEDYDGLESIHEIHRIWP